MALDMCGETPHRRGMVLLREEQDHDAALERSVVLEAMGIAHEVQQTPDGRWALVVDDGDAPAAEAALAAWEAENPPRPGLVARPDYGRSLAGAAVGFAILAFAAYAGLRPARNLVERGSADAARMLDGEWWRAMTALTLHVDLAHVAANAVAIAIFLGAVARRLGPALATWLALAAGVAGNVLTALVTGGGHVSIGASTAVFGALGTLSALQVPRRPASCRYAYPRIAEAGERDAATRLSHEPLWTGVPSPLYHMDGVTFTARALATRRLQWARRPRARGPAEGASVAAASCGALPAPPSRRQRSRRHARGGRPARPCPGPPVAPRPRPA